MALWLKLQGWRSCHLLRQPLRELLHPVLASGSFSYSIKASSWPAGSLNSRNSAQPFPQQLYHPQANMENCTNIQLFWGLWAALDERGLKDSGQRKPCSTAWMGILGITQPQAHSSSATHNTQSIPAPLHLSPSYHQQGANSKKGPQP